MEFIAILFLAVGCFNMWMFAMGAVSTKQYDPYDNVEIVDHRLAIAGICILNGIFGLLIGSAVTRIGKRLLELESRSALTPKDSVL
jgi:hypothetical protein